MIKGTMLHVVIMVRGILLILGEMSDFNFLCTCWRLWSLMLTSSDVQKAPFFGLLEETSGKTTEIF
jgi:hypothetical protein